MQLDSEDEAGIIYSGDLDGGKLSEKDADIIKELETYFKERDADVDELLAEFNEKVGYS